MSIDEYKPDDKAEVKGLRLITGYLGLLLGLVGIVVLLPLIYIAFDPAEQMNAPYFAWPGLAMIAVGFGLFFPLLYHKKHGRLEKHQDAFIVVSCWLIAILGTSFPFWLSGRLNFHQAIFEVTSGWTTTGLSVFDVEAEHVNSFLLARSNTTLFGGIGLVLIMISVFSDRYAMRLYSAEGHSDRFLPNLLRSSRLMVIIYLGFISAGVIGYMSFGMSPFDAVNHSITAVATGGFSTHADSIGYFSPAVTGAVYKTVGIQIVTICLMVIGSISFVSWVFLFRGKFKVFFCNCENKAQLFIIALAFPLLLIASAVSGVVTSNDLPMFGLFNVVSALTTCGFQISTFTANTFPAILIILTLLMLFGGQTNSTAGGIKIFRIHLFFRSIFIKIKNTLSPSNTRHSYRVNLYENDLYLDEEVLHQSNLYVLSYLTLFITGAMIFTFDDNPIGQAMFETASMIGTVGLSTGMVVASSPTFYFYLSSVLMVLGRLEIFIVFYSLIYLIKTPVRTVRSLLERRNRNVQ